LALEKDPAKRYSSAGELGLDERRHLRGELVEAGPRGLVGRLARLVTRSTFP